MFHVQCSACGEQRVLTREGVISLADEADQRGWRRYAVARRGAAPPYVIDRCATHTLTPLQSQSLALYGSM